MPYANYPLHFSDDMLPSIVDGWFEAMAGLYRVAPWQGESSTRFPVYVTIGSQGINDAVLHPLALNCGRRGFALFAGPDDHQAWLALEATDGVPENAPAFARLELTFGSLAEAHPAVQSELERHERNMGDTVPSVWFFDDTGKPRPGDVDDLTAFEAVAAAIAWTPDASSEGVESFVAGQISEPVTRVVSAGGGEFDVELSGSPLGAEAALPASALLDGLRALEAKDDGWLLQGPERRAIEYRLGRRFAHSPEASELMEGTWYWQTFAHWAVSHIGSTVASLDASGLEEVVFDIVPRKVSADVDYARPFIESLRAFYRWLEREYSLPQASACLARLNAPESVERLEALMADSTNFSRTKVMVMQARARGIDPSTPEGAMQMQAEYNARIADMQSPLAGFDPFYDTRNSASPLDPVAARKQKTKRKTDRKAARKARKKNR
ncbi:hypothetical protein [Granulosicoccus antarcticus]|uniref:Uncharacterized protein n=1 Tax=Granulosicoccus antarcticus IMCC3135 TaxID=1192854 RepID=A0A2Z2NHB5_9GAMM|nr:hypothetical protein [Granulosicoccus antarcticus]ASJ70682.1 hypothetical protein IMCC3135_02845 [Granulosicoccus antarcticus IMCC3135]